MNDRLRGCDTDTLGTAAAIAAVLVDHAIGATAIPAQALSSGSRVGGPS
jgi:hypothetical protein